MLKTGEWLSISILGLTILFIFTVISFFLFLIGPKSSGPTTTVEPSTALIQIISITIGPAVALSFFLNVFSEGSKLSYSLVIIAGAFIIISMIYVNTLILHAADIVELPQWFFYTPLIFLVIGILFILISIISYKRGKQRIQREYGFE